MLALNARDTTWAILTPLLLWGGHFLFCYVVVAIACARGVGGAEILGVPWVHLATAIATAAVLALLGWSVLTQSLYLRRHRNAVGDQPERARFVAGTSAAVSAVSFLGTVWVALPIALLPVCAARGTLL